MLKSKTDYFYSPQLLQSIGQTKRHPHFCGFFDTQSQAPIIAAHANATEMVHSLVGAGHGRAMLNMLPRTSTSYAGDMLIALPIEGDLRVLTLSVA